MRSQSGLITCLPPAEYESRSVEANLVLQTEKAALEASQKELAAVKAGAAAAWPCCRLQTAAYRPRSMQGIPC